ncbi:MAG TPA: ATP-binding protein [Streptosporangiaceae bacterium]|nr:ATP-binding protein [Streptosporangiaceae bacterium]
MSETAVALDQRMISFTLPSTPESVRIARFHVRAALGFHGLGEYADDAEIITSELVTNAICHVADDPAETIAITVARVWRAAAVAVIVADSSPCGPVMRQTTGTSERGRGLHVVAALSADWGWRPQPGGKAIYAVIVKEVQAND